jgi:glycosyltransferase involved in cell wall biosynthesis
VYNITLSFVLPVYHDAGRLIPFIEQCLTVLPQYVADYEIILVDDHSSDETVTIADNLAAHYDPILIIHQPQRRGYGNALQTGADVARGDYILIADTNEQINLEQIDVLLSYTGRYDVVIGYSSQPRISWLQRGYDRMFTSLFHLDFKATGCSLSLVRSDIFHSLAFKTNSSLILAELYARACHLGYSSIQIGLQHSGKTRAIPGPGYVRAALPSFAEMLWLWMFLHKKNHGTWLNWGVRTLLAAGLIVAARSTWLLLRHRMGVATFSEIKAS